MCVCVLYKQMTAAFVGYSCVYLYMCECMYICDDMYMSVNLIVSRMSICACVAFVCTL